MKECTDVVTTSRVEELIRVGESLSVELKDDRGPLSDREIYEAIVCLANNGGGILLIGVRNDGSITGDLDELLVLNHLQRERRVDATTVGLLTQRGEGHARGVLERLVEHGLIEPRGEKRGRVYHLSAALYRQLGTPEGYVHAHGFDSIRQEAMVMEYVTAHGLITRKDVVKLCTLNERQAGYLLRRLVTKGKLRKVGEKRGSYYKLSD